MSLTESHWPEDGPVRKNPTPFLVARMLTVLTCLTQVRGPDALGLVDIADPFLKATSPPNPIWSALGESSEIRAKPIAIPLNSLAVILTQCQT
jgi:hypothetical protein